jgi:hypothetical protein
VEGRGLGLTAVEIHLDRGRNELRIDQPGLMTLWVDRDLQGRPTTPQQLEIRWQGRLHFDGLKAIFEQDVVARRQYQEMRTRQMEITLSGRVDFGQRAAPTRPEVAQIVCRGGVHFDGRALDEQGRLLSMEQSETIDLSINQITGDLFAAGPGWLRQVRRQTEEQTFALPGAKRTEPKTPPADGWQEGQLSYLHVRFQRLLTGDLKSRKLSFGDRVRAIYGPVSSWESVLDPDSAQGLGPDGMVLNCDRMTVAQSPEPGAAEGALELEALGNTSVDGSTFRATGKRITYTAAKQKLMLEGDGRAPAELFRRERIGAAESRFAARVIEYWRTTNHVWVHDARSGQVSGR